MTDAFTGEIRLFPYDYAPNKWITCDGRLLNVANPDYHALFAVIGAAYGGDGVNTFAVPNLAGRTAVGAGEGAGLTSRSLGQTFGESGHTLTLEEMPPHTHQLTAGLDTGSTGLQAEPSSGAWLSRSVQFPSGGGTPSPLPSYSADTSAPGDYLYLGAVSPSGESDSAAHENRQPSLALNFCICTDGLFPVRPS